MDVIGAPGVFPRVARKQKLEPENETSRFLQRPPHHSVEVAMVETETR